jgi:hypothetical protein
MWAKKIWTVITNWPIKPPDFGGGVKTFTIVINIGAL